MTDTTFIEGRSPEKARELLSKAREAGLEPGVVRTTSKGYIVPASLLGGTNADDKGEDTDPAPESDEFDPSEHSVAEVEQYLESATEAERERVLAAEKDGKARKGLVGDEGEQN